MVHLRYIHSTNRRLILPALLFLAFGAGCAGIPGHPRPTIQPPAFWNSLSDNSAAPSHVIAAASADLSAWWEGFNDPCLNELVRGAIQANFDLRTAAARLGEARAARAAVASERYPRAEARGQFQRSETSDYYFGPGLPGDITNLYDGGFDALWELDFWGRIAKQTAAADAGIASAVENQRDVLVRVLAETARAYVELRGSQRRQEIARANIQVQQAIVDLTRQRYEAQITDQLDVERAEAQLAAIQANLPQLEQLEKQSLHQLAFLLGLSGSAPLIPILDKRPIPPLPPRIPVGLPSEILRRRPDIRRAERDLAAAAARVEVAVADWFPHFSLTGSLGFKSTEPGDWGELAGRFWSLGPQFSWPVLDFGRIRGNIHVQSAREAQALIAYEKTVAAAFREVEDALTAYGQEQLRNQSLAQSVASSRTAAGLARERYEAGITGFLAVLDAERSLYAAADALARSDEQMALNLIALYKALGGGWNPGMFIAVDPAKEMQKSRE
ncbi:MAG: efflux transporter outer membrane subunit [bacterium]